ncbi:Glyoxal oxidase [Rhynchospora pubera]|uniref:Glyoxal oxidase n=1 Tax=Rhynchospora pubera TaxID=906938 RepID=A0AAV8HUS0_9POAL|nr:Glyoxal oxidase [Rhynchospora pubera]KAJ4821608.1 Glyoxal oxidase [Rhynchospora pubera]
MVSPLQNAFMAFVVLLLAVPLANAEFSFPFWEYFNPVPGEDYSDLPGYEPNPEPEPVYRFDAQQTEIQKKAADNTLLMPVPTRTQKVKWTSITVAPNTPGGFAGSWEIISNNTGVNCMHLAIARHGKAIMIDTVALGNSLLKLPDNKCRRTSNAKNATLDCFAHSAEFDYDTGKIRELKIETDPWCSSGGFTPDGTLINSGGFALGERSVRWLKPCPTCDWSDYPNTLFKGRWYGTQVTLPNGKAMVLGARRAFSFELIPPPGQMNKGINAFNFFRETTDDSENNLYPFVHLIPDGNLFVFANDRAIIMNPNTGRIVRELPNLKDGLTSRTYPPSGMSALLPIDLSKTAPGQPIQAEVIVCGGGYKKCFKDEAPMGRFPDALKDCNRISVTNPAATWVKEDMPAPRTMGDLLILPTGDLLMINGAGKGCSGWTFARDPVLTPFIYKPNEAVGKRWQALTASAIPRMYHATSAVLPDATIMVAGGNTNQRYDFRDTTMFPTEMRVERLTLPYLNPKTAVNRPVISEGSISGGMRYGQPFTFQFSMPKEPVDQALVMVTMYAPPYTTHGFSMSQRLLILKIAQYTKGAPTKITVTAPPTANIAPQGYYYLFVVAGGVPSKATWVQVM